MISQTLNNITMTIGLIAAAFAATAIPSSAQSQDSRNKGGADMIVAEVDGNQISLREFMNSRPLALFSAQNTFYETERKAVDTYVDDLLLQKQAQKEGVSVDELLKRHVDSQIGADPSEEALRVYYEGLDTHEPFESVRKQILDSIRQKRLDRAKTAYKASLRDAAHVAIRLGPPRANISLADTPVKGDPNAPLMVVEYADYECPYCQIAQPVLDRLETDYAGKVAFAFKDLPLPMHAHAQKAAEAAQCAGLQGKYWEFHDQLFATKQLELPQLKATAHTLGLDIKTFDACLDSGSRAANIKAVIEEAQTLAFPGTPAILLNGRFLNGVPKYEQLRQIVDEELSNKAASHKPASGLKEQALQGRP